MRQQTYLDFGENGRDCVELLSLRKEGGQGRLILDQWAGVDDETVDSFVLLRLID